MGCEGDEFITFAPYFPEYKVFVESAGGKLVPSPPTSRTSRSTLPPLKPL
jgi:aspartate/methionine/tyrosine aminotransferase